MTNLQQTARNHREASKSPTPPPVPPRPSNYPGSPNSTRHSPPLVPARPAPEPPSQRAMTAGTGGNSGVGSAARHAAEQLAMSPTVATGRSVERSLGTNAQDSGPYMVGSQSKPTIVKTVEQSLRVDSTNQVAESRKIVSSSVSPSLSNKLASSPSPSDTRSHSPILVPTGPAPSPPKPPRHIYVKDSAINATMSPRSGGFNQGRTCPPPPHNAATKSASQQASSHLSDSSTRSGAHHKHDVSLLSSFGKMASAFPSQTMSSTTASQVASVLSTPSTTSKVLSQPQAQQIAPAPSQSLTPNPPPQFKTLVEPASYKASGTEPTVKTEVKELITVPIGPTPSPSSEGQDFSSPQNGGFSWGYYIFLAIFLLCLMLLVITLVITRSS